MITVILYSGAAWAQGVPLGPEFRVNTYTTLPQRLPAVAADGSGNFVVVWQSSDQDGDFDGIFGQRFDSSGAPLGPEFRVNTYTTGNQCRPAVAADPSGNFVVVWYVSATSLSALFGQRYDASGGPLGPEFSVSTAAAGGGVNASPPSVATDAAGNFVVVWRTFAAASLYDILGRRYSSAGVPLGSEFRVNTYTTADQETPAVAADPAGNFLVVWDSDAPGGSVMDVFGQRYASSGVPLGPEFRVNTDTTDVQFHASVAADPLGNFIVAWTDAGPNDVRAQRYSSSGVPLGGEFRVNTYTTLSQGDASIAADSSGNFVVTWESQEQDGDNEGIFGQRYASSGVPLGPEFRVNTYTTSYQGNPAVAADSLGRFVVVWASYLQGDADLSIYGQRYDVMVPVDLMDLRVE